MIGWQKIYAFISTFIYIALFVIFIRNSASDITWKCNYEVSCLTFCSDNVNETSTFDLFTKFVKSEFGGFSMERYSTDANDTQDGSKYAVYYSYENRNVSERYEQQVFTVSRGQPKCVDTIVKDPKEPNYEFMSVRLIFSSATQSFCIKNLLYFLVCWRRCQKK